jgi:hypothetical protein
MEEGEEEPAWTVRKNAGRRGLTRVSGVWIEFGESRLRG